MSNSDNLLHQSIASLPANHQKKSLENTNAMTQMNLTAFACFTELTLCGSTLIYLVLAIIQLKLVCVCIEIGPIINPMMLNLYLSPQVKHLNFKSEISECHRKFPNFVRHFGIPI